MNKRTNEFISEAYSTACAHGFHEDVEKGNFEHCMMLVVTEISEMVEADRKGRYANLTKYDKGYIALEGRNDDKSAFERMFVAKVKDTVEDEMADICIRLYDLCGVLGITFDDAQIKVGMMDDFDNLYADLSFTKQAFALTRICALENESKEVVIAGALLFVECMAEKRGIDLEWHIEHKMKYNKTRQAKHGKKY